jgi:hypothetical protein
MLIPQQTPSLFRCVLCVDKSLKIKIMNIEIGDIVQLNENGKLKLAWLEVLELHGDNALCLYRVLDKDPNGDERPTALIPTEGLFPLSSLSIMRKNNN